MRLITYSSIFTYIILIINHQAIAGIDDKIDSLKSMLVSEKKMINKCKILLELSDNADDGVWQKYNDTLGLYTSQLISIPKMASDSNVVALRANYFNNAAVIYFENTDYYNGVTYLDSSFLLMKKISNYELMGVNRMNIGSMYYRLGQYQEALEYYTLAEKILRLNPVGKSTFILFNNFGKTYLSMGDTLRAYKYLFQARGISLDLAIKDQSLAYLFRTLGWIKFTKNDLDSSFYFFNLGQNIANENGDIKGTAINQAGLAEIYFVKGLKLKATKTIDSAFNVIKDTKNFYEIREIANSRCNIYKRLNEWEKAMGALIVSKMASDSISKMENINTSISIKLKLEIETHEKERMAILEKIKLKKEASRRTQITGISAVIFMILAVFMFLRKIKPSYKLAQYLGLVGFLLLFEFIDMMLGPWVDQFSFGNLPLYMVINIGIATAISPVRTFLENRYRRQTVTSA